MSCWSTSFWRRETYFETQPPGIDLEMSTSPGTPDLGMYLAFRVLDLLSKGHGAFFFPIGKSTVYMVYIYNIYISYNIYIIITVLASFLYSMVPLFFAWTKSCEAWFNISTPFCSPSNCCCASVQLTASRASCGQMTGTGIVWCLGLVQQEIYGKSSWI